MSDDERPPVWVGHVSVACTDVAASAAFYRSLGLRDVVDQGDVVILELRGGTHLVVSAGEPATTAAFDLMVDDIDAKHEAWTRAGFAPSAIEQGRVHRSFTLTDPAGTLVTVYDTHVVGPV